MIQKLEDLRKHEDNLIFNEANIFLIAETLLITAITNEVPVSVKILIVCTAIILSILWILIGIRHRVLLDYYNTEIKDTHNQNPDCISSIHRKLSNWKEKNFWYVITGHNYGFSATNIRCIFLPAIFLIFWILLLILSLRC